MLVAVAAAVAIAALGFVFLLRQQDLPKAAEVAPWKHLEGRKAAIYENLRDLQFEYRVGKLSDSDYQRTKGELQAELATVLAEIERLKAETPAAVNAPTPRSVPAKAAKQAASGYDCPHCKAHFEKPLKFCGECGRPMSATGAQA